MSRRALWPAQRAVPVPSSTEPAAPSPAQGASQGVPEPLRVRSEIDLQVKLGRLAGVLGEAAQIFRELSEVPLAVARERALMSSMGNQETPARMLTAEDLAARMQVDARTIRRWRKAGKIPAGIEVAGVIRWTPESIDAWMASGGCP